LCGWPGVKDMSEYEAATYGQHIAEVYDDWYAGQDTGGVVEFLCGLARGGDALELGIGTGRVALPLSTRGVKVHGIDSSPAMVDKMRKKPGGENVPVTLGDFADVPVQGLFDLIYIVFNTFFSLLTQKAQVKCFQSCAQHLKEEGAFVLENFVPDLTRFDRGQRTDTISIGTDMARIDVSLHDSVQQQVHAQHILIEEKGVRLYPVQLRYVWPSEMDLMARLAKLELRNRFGGWRGEAFSNASARHISVYRHPGAQTPKNESL
jgi:SAM-dependent methyltransferase